MKRLLFGMLGATVVAAFVGCAENPTKALLTGVDRVQTSVAYTEILVGDSVQVSARSLDEQGNTLVLFPAMTSDVTSVVTLTPDTIQTGNPAPIAFVFAKAVGFGTATITATEGGQTATIGIQTWPAKVNVTAAPDTMGSGETSLLTAEAVDQLGQPVTGPTAVVYTWSSDDPSVVAVDSATGDATAGAPGIAVLDVAVQGGASTSAPITVVPGTFGGTLSATTGNPGETIDITRAAAGPIFDADTEVFFGGAFGTQAFVDSFTDDVLTVVIPATTGVAGTVEILLTNMGPGQLAQLADFTATATLDDATEPTSGDPATGFLINANGSYYSTLHGGCTDGGPTDPSADCVDWFRIENTGGATATVTINVNWLTPADVDLEVYDAALGYTDASYFSQPEEVTVDIPAGETWYIWHNLWTPGAVADNVNMTITGLP
jgi:hypothetical protein